MESRKICNSKEAHPAPEMNSKNTRIKGQFLECVGATKQCTPAREAPPFGTSHPCLLLQVPAPSSFPPPFVGGRRAHLRDSPPPSYRVIRFIASNLLGYVKLVYFVFVEDCLWKSRIFRLADWYEKLGFSYRTSLFGWKKVMFIQCKVARSKITCYSLLARIRNIFFFCRRCALSRPIVQLFWQTIKRHSATLTKNELRESISYLFSK